MAAKPALSEVAAAGVLEGGLGDTWKLPALRELRLVSYSTRHRSRNGSAEPPSDMTFDARIFTHPSLALLDDQLREPRQDVPETVKESFLRERQQREEQSTMSVGGVAGDTPEEPNNGGVRRRKEEGREEKKQARNAIAKPSSPRGCSILSNKPPSLQGH